MDEVWSIVDGCSSNVTDLCALLLLSRVVCDSGRVSQHSSPSSGKFEQ